MNLSGVDLLSSSSSPCDMSTKRPTPRRQRVFEFRNFILDTFGKAWLQDCAQQRVVLDIAGGKGDLSWLLRNADGINSVIVDPRATDHSKLERTANWYVENKDKDINSRGPQGPLVSLSGSPTVSPMTALWYCSEPFCFRGPETYFFALSHAPPTLSKNSAIMMPDTVPNIRYCDSVVGTS